MCFENWDTPLTHSPNHALTLVMNPKLELQQSQCIGLDHPSKRFSFVSLSLCIIFHAKRFTNINMALRCIEFVFEYVMGPMIMFVASF